ncbi:hypothetical protein SNEBB_002512 [Seison nebaliae]|nr:hypothetical protein SNEBB_002512 [Seison nebaliae]
MNYSGYLCKYTNPVKRYQRRWFELSKQTGLLEYYRYEEEKNTKARGSLFLKRATIEPSEEEFVFIVTTETGKFFRLKATNSSERKGWIDEIREVAENLSDVSDISEITSLKQLTEDKRSECINVLYDRIKKSSIDYHQSRDWMDEMCKNIQESNDNEQISLKDIYRCKSFMESCQKKLEEVINTLGESELTEAYYRLPKKSSNIFSSSPSEPPKKLDESQSIHQFSPPINTLITTTSTTIPKKLNENVTTSDNHSKPDIVSNSSMDNVKLTVEQHSILDHEKYQEPLETITVLSCAKLPNLIS